MMIAHKGGSLYKNLMTDVQICYSGNSITKIIENISQLIKENNSIVLTDSTFFYLAMDELKQGLVLRVARLYDNDTRSESIQEMIRELCSKYHNSITEDIKVAIGILNTVEHSKQVSINLQFRNKMYAHVDKNRATSLKDLIITIDDYRHIFNETIKALNIICRDLYNGETWADGYAGDDIILGEMRWLEKAKWTRRYIEIHEKNNHPSLTYYPK